MNHLIPALALAVLGAGAPARAALLLHGDSFEAGNPVSYTTKFGAPEIGGPPNLFGSNALVFNNFGNLPTYYEQIEYAVDSDALPFQAFSIAFDFYVEELVGNTVRDRDALFTVFLDDYGGLNRMTLEPDGNLYIDNLALGSRTTLAGFQNARVYRLLMSYDLQGDLWDLSIDDVPLWNGALAPSTRLRDIRFHLGGRYPGYYTGNFTNVFLDNVQITAVPLPAGGCLFATGIAAVLARRLGTLKSTA